MCPMEKKVLNTCPECPRSIWLPHTHTSSSYISSTLGEAWDQLKKSLADEADVHLKFSSKVIQKAWSWIVCIDLEKYIQADISAF